LEARVFAADLDHGAACLRARHEWGGDLNLVLALNSEGVCANSRSMHVLADIVLCTLLAVTHASAAQRNKAKSTIYPLRQIYPSKST